MREIERSHRLEAKGILHNGVKKKAYMKYKV